MRHSRGLVVTGLLFVTVFFATALSVLANDRPILTEKNKGGGTQKQGYVQPSDPALYAGTETCKTCHEDKYKSYEETRHYATDLNGKKGPEWQGCEACHGPGKAHVDGGGDKTKIFSFHDGTAAQLSERCLACHTFADQQINFLRSEHAKNSVACLDCHSVHKAAVEKSLLKAPQSTLCFQCHLSVKADFSKPSHHRVEEGLVNCADCHNPHGGFNVRQIRSSASRDSACVRCHASKAGPFAVEHAVMRTEGCTACHTPHGSANPRLLKRSQINLLCLECHTDTVGSAAPAIPSFHNQAQKYQACTSCHVAVHGSNSDRFLMKP
jgi:DmsE family decaheme c-type cytochrome